MRLATSTSCRNRGDESMPYTVDAISINGNMRAAFAADKPLFIGRNVLEYQNVNPQWRRSGSWASGQDDTAAGFYAFRAADNFAADPTKPIFVSASPGPQPN